MTELEKPAVSLRIWQHGVVFLFACIILISRRPDAIFHAQFFAEDGHVWFADAYNLGWWNALLRAHAGYFQTFPRLAAALALLAPLALAPLVLNLAALAAEALPVNLLLSSRSSAWGSLRFRALLAVAYMALPNCREMIIIVTSSQWLLTLSAFLVLTSTPAASTAGRAFDSIILLLSGLSGPFCIFLLPFAVFMAWKRHDPRRHTPVIVLAACCLLQSLSLLVLDAHTRPHYPLGATPAMFARLLGGDVVLAPLLGHNALAALSGSGILVLLACAAIAGMAIATVYFFKLNLEMRLFLILAGMLFAGSLLSPSTYPPPGSTVWHELAFAPGCRYWYFPSLACAWSILGAARSRIKGLHAASIVLLCIMCFGVVRDWQQPAWKDFHFADYARSFEAAPPGTVMVIPENPVGWTIRLVKHGPQ